VLTADELASMRDTMNDSLPGTAIVQTQNWVSDGGGGGTTLWLASGTYDCRVTPTGGFEQDQGDRVQPETEYIFTLSALTEIDEDAQIVYSGGTYDVIATPSPRSFEVSRRVEVKVRK
jgi:head-tail adaptor